MHRKWSKEAIGFEIADMYQSGQNLNYANMASESLPLLRAATRYFGTWEAAVTYAGLDYDEIRRYKSWTRERIINKIKELYAQGVDLSWRNVCLHVDPQLAAAATKKSHFGSWREAVESAGLTYDSIRKYREWDDQRIISMVKEFHANGVDLNAKSMENEDITLITAARRRFNSWHEALTAAGLDYRKIVQRAPFKRGLGRGQNTLRSAAGKKAA